MLNKLGLLVAISSVIVACSAPEVGANPVREEKTTESDDSGTKTPDKSPPPTVRDSGTVAEEDTGAPVDQKDSGPVGDGGLAHDASDGGGGVFGAVCKQDGDCQSKACFKGNQGAYCSLKCKQATAATDCPKPPTSGVCNGQGYCKK